MLNIASNLDFFQLKLLFFFFLEHLMTLTFDLSVRGQHHFAQTLVLGWTTTMLNMKACTFIDSQNIFFFSIKIAMFFSTSHDFDL